MKPEQERLRTVLVDTMTLLCKNGLHYGRNLRVQGLIGVTMDDVEVFIIHINEMYEAGAATAVGGAKSNQQITSNSIAGTVPVGNKGMVARSPSGGPPRSPAASVSGSGGGTPTQSMALVPFVPGAQHSPAATGGMSSRSSTKRTPVNVARKMRGSFTSPGEKKAKQQLQFPSPGGSGNVGGIGGRGAGFMSRAGRIGTAGRGVRGRGMSPRGSGTSMRGRGGGGTQGFQSPGNTVEFSLRGRGRPPGPMQSSRGNGPRPMSSPGVRASLRQPPMSPQSAPSTPRQSFAGTPHRAPGMPQQGMGTPRQVQPGTPRQAPIAPLQHASSGSNIRAGASSSHYISQNLSDLGGDLGGPSRGTAFNQGGFGGSSSDYVGRNNASMHLSGGDAPPLKRFKAEKPDAEDVIDLEDDVSDTRGVGEDVLGQFDPASVVGDSSIIPAGMVQQTQITRVTITRDAQGQQVRQYEQVHSATSALPNSSGAPPTLASIKTESMNTGLNSSGISSGIGVSQRFGTGDTTEEDDGYLPDLGNYTYVSAAGGSASNSGQSSGQYEYQDFNYYADDPQQSGMSGSGSSVEDVQQPLGVTGAGTWMGVNNNDGIQMKQEFAANRQFMSTAEISMASGSQHQNPGLLARGRGGGMSRWRAGAPRGRGGVGGSQGRRPKVASFSEIKGRGAAMSGETWKMVARFVCSIPGCDQSFSNKSNLIRHQRTAHNSEAGLGGGGSQYGGDEDDYDEDEDDDDLTG